MDELLEYPFGTVQEGATTFSALNGTRFQVVNGTPLNMTDITNGQDGQMIAILGDGNTTLVNNSRLVLGGDLLLEEDKIHILVYLTDAWYSLSQPEAYVNPYVGKLVRMISGEVTHTQVGGGVSEDFNVKIRALADLTGMTQFRLSGYSAGIIGGDVNLSWSTNGSSWNTDASPTLSITSTPGFFTTSFGTLDVGARIATCYLRLVALQSTGGDTLNLSSCTIEFKP